MRPIHFFLIIVLVIFSLTVSGQIITNDGGGFGLMDESGKKILPNSYAMIRRIILRMNETSYFIYKTEGKYGIINSKNMEDTGARFDSIEVWEHGYIILHENKKKGYMAEPKPLEFKLIEPQFETITLNKKLYSNDLYYPSDYLVDTQIRNLIVKFNDQWGVVNYNTGDWVIKPKYKQPLTYNNEYRIYTIKSMNSNEIWLINPENGREFYFPFEIEYRLIDGELHTVSKYKSDGEFVIQNFTTGKEIFRYLSKHHNLSYHYINPQILEVTEKIYHEDLKGPITHNTLWFSLTSGREMLYVPLRESEEIKVVKDENKQFVYIWETYGRKRKVIGEIQGTFVIWKNKKYERN